MAAMRGPAFWITRLLVVCALVFAILLATEVIKGGTVQGGWASALFWASASAAVFTGSRYYQARKGLACALCRDLPEA
jgi:preprotein translocase subunit SecG